MQERDNNQQQSHMTDFDTLRSAMVRDYVERLRSLLNDGYRCMFTTELCSSYTAKLVHRSNGNRVMLQADFIHYTLWQKTNGVLKHSHKYTQEEANIDA